MAGREDCGEQQPGAQTPLSQPHRASEAAGQGYRCPISHYPLLPVPDTTKTQGHAGTARGGNIWLCSVAVQQKASPTSPEQRPP